MVSREREREGRGVGGREGKVGYRGKSPKTETDRQTVATFKEENSDSTQLE